MSDTDLDRLAARLDELAARAYATSRYTYTDFLGLSEQDVFRRRERDLTYAGVAVDGGADGCERVMVRFGGEELCGYTEPFPIVCLRVAPVSEKFAEDLTHRDILGALMHLGIERDKLGDIFLEEGAAYVFCAEGMADVIAADLDRVRHTSVTCKRATPPASVGSRGEEMTVQVASERADALVAAVFHLSREDAQELFRQQKVFLNGRMTESVSAAVAEDTVVSARGYGRFRYLGTPTTSRKGKLNARIFVYK